MFRFFPQNVNGIIPKKSAILCYLNIIYNNVSNVSFKLKAISRTKSKQKIYETIDSFIINTNTSFDFNSKSFLRLICDIFF